MAAVFGAYGKTFYAWCWEFSTHIDIFFVLWVEEKERKMYSIVKMANLFQRKRFHNVISGFVWYNWFR